MAHRKSPTRKKWRHDDEKYSCLQAHGGLRQRAYRACGPTALPIRRTRPARKRSKPPSATTTGITGWIQRQSIRWCSSLAMTARSYPRHHPSVKQIGTGGILPTTEHGANAMSIPANSDAWGTDRNCYLAVNSHPSWSICFSARPAKAYAQEQQKNLCPGQAEKSRLKQLRRKFRRSPKPRSVSDGKA